MHRRDILKLAASWAQQAAEADWKPAFFDDHQNETVVALTELIIPATNTTGAKAAHVNRYIDLFLRDGEPTQPASFMAGLNWLDGHTQIGFQELNKGGRVPATFGCSHESHA
jgi:Gluconate 2-dehydrogenase subunit 3